MGLIRIVFDISYNVPAKISHIVLENLVRTFRNVDYRPKAL